MPTKSSLSPGPTQVGHLLAVVARELRPRESHGGESTAPTPAERALTSVLSARRDVTARSAGLPAWKGDPVEPTYAVRTSDDTVEAWSTARLPFEPKGTLLQFRDELRTALGSLTPCPGACMRATYGAADDGQFVDTENVLLYNVGTSHLRHLAARATTFERAFTYPTPPGESGMRPDRLHYVRYVVGPTADLSHWASAGRIAAFEDVDVSSLAKPGPTWAAIRTQSAPPSPRLGAPQRFLVRLRIRDRRPAGGTKPRRVDQTRVGRGHQRVPFARR